MACKTQIVSSEGALNSWRVNWKNAQKFEGAIAGLRREHAQAIQELRDRLQAEHDQQVAQMRLEHEAERARLDAEHASVTAELRRELESAEQDSSASATETGRIRTELEELQVAHASQIEALQSRHAAELEAAASERQRVENNLRETQLRLGELTARNGELLGEMQTLQDLQASTEREKAELQQSLDATRRSLAENQAELERSLRSGEASQTQTNELQRQNEILRGRVDERQGRLEALEAQINALATEIGQFDARRIEFERAEEQQRQQQADFDQRREALRSELAQLKLAKHSFKGTELLCYKD